MFRHIREAIDAFRPRDGRAGFVRYALPPIPYEHIEAVHEQTLGAHRHEKRETPRPNLAVLIVVILPISLTIGMLLARLTESAFPTTVSMQHNLGSVFASLVAIVLSYLSDGIEGVIYDRIPFGRLNPFFGRKIAESVEALKKHA